MERYHDKANWGRRQPVHCGSWSSVTARELTGMCPPTVGSTISSKGRCLLGSGIFSGLLAQEPGHLGTGFLPVSQQEVAASRKVHKSSARRCVLRCSARFG